MSLLIEGMGMPRNCKDCPCREYGKFSYESDWCCLNRKNIVNAETISPNCPLSEIPTPHGRLIDADRLIKALEKQWNVDDDQDFANKTVWREIESAPTVIEKEMN